MSQQYRSILDAIVQGDDLLAPQGVQAALDAGLPPPSTAMFSSIPSFLMSFAP